MQDEIISGLKNALERGSSMEEAVQSFLNAGYSPASVREAAQLLSTGASTIVLSSEYQQNTQQSSQNESKSKSEDTAVNATQFKQQYVSNYPKRSIGKLVIIIILIILLVLVLGGIIATFFFGDKILEFLKS